MENKKSTLSCTRTILNNVFLFLLLVIVSSFKPDELKKDSSSFPIPTGIDRMLFYVQRTINENTIVYELNEDKYGNINEQNPISIYWIKYTEGGSIDPLTYIQKNYAYGIQSKLTDKEKMNFSFEFVSYHKKQFYLLKSTLDHKYHVYGYINNKLSILKNIFVKIDGGTFWFPNVKQVEVKAEDPVNLSEITEIINP